VVLPPFFLKEETMKHLNDFSLEQHLLDCVRRERAAVADVLRYLREVEARQLFLARGFSSLFAYCTGKLGYSEPEAYLRIQAMRLMRAVPEVEARIESGALSMSVAAEIQGAARREKMTAPAVHNLVVELSGTSKREAERKLAALFPGVHKPEQARPISGEMVEIRFTVTKEEAALLAELLNRKSHANFERSYRKLFMDLARAAKQKMESVSRVPRKEIPPKDAALLGPDQAQKRSRHIPAQTKRFIWKRDHGRCQYQDPQSGQRCESRHGLQIDHIRPFALGGKHKPENLRLLCGAHNRWRSGS
jgi:hypothetical protein